MRAHRERPRSARRPLRGSVQGARARNGPRRERGRTGPPTRAPSAFPTETSTEAGPCREASEGAHERIPGRVGGCSRRWPEAEEDDACVAMPSVPLRDLSSPPPTVVPRTELTRPSTHLSGRPVFRARNLHGEEPKGKKTKLLTKKKNF